MTSDLILLSKQDAFSRKAGTVAELLFGDRVKIFTGQVGDAMPKELLAAKPAFLLSFLSPWIIPQSVLDRAGIALNFHPGSTAYPGIGCYNFALYEGASLFGPVCHHMLSRVDSGTVVEERLFPVLETDTVESLKYRTMVTMLALFHDICSLIASGQELRIASRQWSRRAFTHKEMEALKRILPDMPEEEVAKRVRATTYPGYPGPYIESGGERFYISMPDRPPLA